MYTQEQIMRSMRSAEWKPVLDPRGHGYFEGFDREREYDFVRYPDKVVERFKISDQNAYFNIANLYWRDPDWQKSPQ